MISDQLSVCLVAQVRVPMLDDNLGEKNWKRIARATLVRKNGSRTWAAGGFREKADLASTLW